MSALQQASPTPLGPRIRREQRILDAMIGIYCHDHHATRTALCEDCETLRRYACQRLASCPFQETKPVCNRCAVHCYSPSLRERVRVVMRYAGPRMPRRHPWLALLHGIDKLGHPPQLLRRTK